GRGVPPASEQRMLTRLPLLLARLRLGKRDVERGDELGAVAAERVAGARVDQCLDHPLVAEPQVDAVAQVDERAVRPCRGPPCDDRLDRASPDILDRAQPEPDSGVAD